MCSITLRPLAFVLPSLLALLLLLAADGIDAESLDDYGAFASAGVGEVDKRGGGITLRNGHFQLRAPLRFHKRTYDSGGGGWRRAPTSGIIEGSGGRPTTLDDLLRHFQ